MSDEEIFDVVDRNDMVVGTATKTACHSNPRLIHRTVHFTLIDRDTDKILVTRRALDADHDAGKYCFLGEHMNAGESYREGVERGALEELGITATRYKEMAHMIMSYQQQTEFMRFFLVDWDGKALEIEREEIDTYEWIDKELLLQQELDYSEITRRWIKSVDWAVV